LQALAIRLVVGAYTPYRSRFALVANRNFDVALAFGGVSTGFFNVLFNVIQ